jgi:hypothetical protein
MTAEIPKFGSPEYKKEQKRILGRKATDKLRRDARALRPEKELTERKTTDYRLAYTKAWNEAHPEAVKAAHRKSYEKKVAASIDRVAQAMAQAEATRRNIEALEENDDELS